MSKLRLGGVLLAAGGSSRLGEPKQLVPVDGEAAVVRAAQAMLDVCDTEVVVVTGAAAARVEQVLQKLPVRCVRNPGWASGMAGSLRTGLAALGGGDAVLLCVSDQVLVGAAELRRLVAAWHDAPDQPAAAAYNDRLGVPAIFPATLLSELESLEGDTGARNLLRNRTDVTPVPLAAAATDIDTPADLASFRDLRAEPDTD